VGDDCEQASQELTQVFALLGKRWSGLVVAVLAGGPVRFAELRRAIPGISERMLSDRLTELADSGIVVREVLEGPPLGVCYRLTPAGLALRPALEELSRWAQEHLGSGR
jgi:DNA-binding HxlR family transcriptional regulator